MNKILEKFKTLNPTIEIKEETEHVNINKLWNDDTFMCRFDINSDFSPLDNIELPLELSGIFHKSEQKLELIFAPLAKDFGFLSRKSTIYYNGLPFETEYSEPSSSLVFMSKAFRELDISNESEYRNLRVFRDYYRTDIQSPQFKKYFSNKEPISFYIKGDFKKINFDFVSFAKHYNFYARYYDRKSPKINLIVKNVELEKYELPCHSNVNTYPEIITTKAIEPVILDLLHTASDTGSIRLKYIFYYQILEYCSYYYLENEIKRRLGNILKSPDLMSNPINYSRAIIEELKDYTNNTTDKQKLSKLISDYITIDDIKLELDCNLKYFLKDLDFDGGFKLNGIILDEKVYGKLSIKPKDKDQKKEREKIKMDLLNNIVDRIDSIRNVLVHIRETRENKVILPTNKNNSNLTPYLYLIRRIAETIAIKFDN